MSIFPRPNYSLQCLLLSSCLLLASCVEFLAPDVSELSVAINSPADSLITSSGEITFWWDEAPEAASYRLQIVSPSFDNPASILDTLMVDTRLSLLAEEGTYDWRIRMENEGSVSEYQRQWFIIDQTPPFAASLLQPADSSVFSPGELVELHWQSGDRDIDGFVSSVTDSLYLYEDRGGSWELINSWYIASPDPKRIELNSVLSVGSGRYQWQVLSIDEAMNRRFSLFSHFEVE